MSAPLIEVQPDAATLATAVAGELLERLRALQAAGRVPQVVLTGGSIAERIHREVARMAPEADVDWTRVGFWLGDERFVEADSPDRNLGQARAAFLDAVGATLVHAVPAADEVATPEEAAAAYSAELDVLDAADEEHGFDVVMLGVGPDSHVASLFPGHPGAAHEGPGAIAVHDSPKPPPLRVSLTRETLNRGRAVWFLVSGAEKADAVAAALAEPAPDHREVPASGVRGVEETTWFLDHDAASRL